MARKKADKRRVTKAVKRVKGVKFAARTGRKSSLSRKKRSKHLRITRKKGRESKVEKLIKLSRYKQRHGKKISKDYCCVVCGYRSKVPGLHCGQQMRNKGNCW